MKKQVVQIGAATIAMILMIKLMKYACVRAVSSPVKAEPQRCSLKFEIQENGENLALFSACIGKKEPMQIRAWKKDGRQWLFLPAIFREQEVQSGRNTLILREGRMLLEDGRGTAHEIQVCFGSNISFACLETKSGSLDYLQESKENRETGMLCFVGADGGIEYEGNLSKVKIRGNATRLQPKSPFRIELDHAVSLGGLRSSKDYVLLAEFGDISLMRNKIAMELASRTTDQYEPNGSYMDLYVNGEYMGVYLLCEGISIGENRLNITGLESENQLVNGVALNDCRTFAEIDGEDTLAKGYELLENPSDISGGYLLELEYHGRYEGEETTGFRTNRDWSLVIKEPDHASREQVSYIRDVFQQVEDAMYADNWKSPDSGAALEDLVDLESFVHKYMIDEICMNTDPWTSQFLYKDRGDEKIHFGPSWDYDMAFGHYDTGFRPDEFYANCHIWYAEVYDNPEFQRILKGKYREEYLPILEELTVSRMEEWKEELSASAAMNFTRWDIEDIYSRNSVTRTGDTFEEAVDSLKKFIQIRTEFLSSEWLELLQM